MTVMAVNTSVRRAFLIGGLQAGLASLLPLPPVNASPRTKTRGKVGDIGGADVPPTVISLAAFGGTPGASRASIVKAFEQAFSLLKSRGGGTLLVPPGTYDFGTFRDATDIILCRNLRNVAISAYGATFMATTSAQVVPNMFYFFNFQNITIAGASFVDLGFSPWVNWRGMYCVGIQADERSIGLRMVDCHAERVVGLLASNNNAASRSYISDVIVHGEVQNSYYGVGGSFIHKNVKVKLDCHNVRRAFIASSLNGAEIDITTSNSAYWPGSNGLVSLATSGASTGNVENVRVKVDVSGECIHSAYVHFYHQGPEVDGYMRDIDATVNIKNPDSEGNLFLFDHEIHGVQSKTARTWDRISLHGTIAENFKGKIVLNPSVTTSPGTVYIDRNLAKAARGEAIASGFRIR
jgi:hypothetical protein